MTQRHAEIAGAGFAGLAAACALAQRGWSVRVHERADRLRTTGAGIYIYENGLRVLEALAEQAKKAGVEIMLNSTGVSALPDGALTLADGTTRQADLVIGADGTGSR